MTRNTWPLIGIAVAIALLPVLAEAGTHHNQFNRHVGQRTTVHTDKGREALDMYSPPALDTIRVGWTQVANFPLMDA